MAMRELSLHQNKLLEDENGFSPMLTRQPLNDPRLPTKGKRGVLK
jgi:hypothetical protein